MILFNFHQFQSARFEILNLGHAEQLKSITKIVPINNNNKMLIN